MKQLLNDLSIICAGVAVALLAGGFWYESATLGIAGVFFCIASVTFAELRNARR